MVTMAIGKTAAIRATVPMVGGVPAPAMNVAD
jgi:hypothetical protein